MQKVDYDMHHYLKVRDKMVKTPFEVVKHQFKRKERLYINEPAAFDIETTSFTQDGIKYGTMYIWMFGFGQYVAYGRTWEEFKDFLRYLDSKLRLKERRLIIYIHNMKFEWGFLQRQFHFEEVFYRSDHEPLRAYCPEYGFEVRDTFALTNKSLEDAAASLPAEKRVLKLAGKLDYRKPRHTGTPLTYDEAKYCEHDIRALLAVIKHEQSQAPYNRLTNIPMTATGKTRQAMKKACLRGPDAWKFKQTMAELTLSPLEYRHLKEAFMGGAVHTSFRHSGKVINDPMFSKDETSAYPAMLVGEKYPMSKGVYYENPTEEELAEALCSKACVFKLTMRNVRPSFNAPDHPLSRSKCQSLSVDAVIDNGRVVSASYLSHRCTNLDLDTYLKFYDYSEAEITEMWTYDLKYLPTPFVSTILDFYSRKTKLKDVEGQEVEYAYLKELLNSIYGMTVSDIIRDELSWDDKTGFNKLKPTEEQILSLIERYNKNKSRYLSYPWGVWTTALARHRLYSAVMACGSDFVYSDTDSVKGTGNYDDYFEQDNTAFAEKLKIAMRWHGIPWEQVEPTDIYGKKHLLGVWESEEGYTRFKSLGAKRYLRQYADGKLKMTTAGTKTRGDNNALDYLKAEATRTGKDIFDLFEFGMVIPKENSGRLSAVYNEIPFETPLTDYTGNTRTVSEKTCINLTETEYEFTISRDYKNFLELVKKGGA